MTARWWDEPYTAEELAAAPNTRPWSEVFEEFARRTGQKVVPARRVPPSCQTQRRTDPRIEERIRREYANGDSVDDIRRRLRADGVTVSTTTIYRAAKRPAGNRWQ